MKHSLIMKLKIMKTTVKKAGRPNKRSRRVSRNRRTHQITKLATVVCLTLLCAPTLSAQGRTDTVIPTSGSAIRGKVTSATRDEITIDVKGTPQKLPTHELERIVFGGVPSALRQAHESLGDGQYSNALETLKKIKPSQLKGDFAKQDYAFQLAYSKAMLGDEVEGGTASAAKELLDFLKKYPKSFHFYRAAESLGDLAMRLGSYSKAAQYYKQLSRSPAKSLQLRSAVLEANALLAQGPSKSKSALDRYNVVVNSKARGAQAERQRQFALAGKAACEAELGKPDAAIKTAQQVIRDNDSSDIELFAKAYNALGAGFRKSDNPRDAVLAYLHVDLICNRARDAHAESLYYLSKLWPAVGKPDRATEARSRLKSRYPGTTWASR